MTQSHCVLVVAGYLVARAGGRAGGRAARREEEVRRGERDGGEGVDSPKNQGGSIPIRRGE
jgi:hypothetical protein